MQPLNSFFKYVKAGLGFIKKHPDILYSLVLIILVPLVLYFNVNFAVNSFQKNFDTALKQKAFIVEEIFDSFLSDYSDNIAAAGAKIEKLVKENPELAYLEIKLKQGDGFSRVIAYPAEGGKTSEEGQKSLETAELLSWQNNEAVGFLSAEKNARRWNVLKPLHSKNGDKIGLIRMALSLEAVDALLDRTIKISYVFVVLGVFLVLALIINHTRLFEYSVLFRKLQEVDRIKDEFVSMTAHELRTPVSIIKGYSRQLEEKLADKMTPDQKKDLGIIISSSDNLNELITDILEVSRIEQGRIAFDLQKISPEKTIEETIDSLKPKADEKGLSLSFASHPSPLLITADPDRLRQILTNLIANAIKYTFKGKIGVSAGADKNKCRISIQDTGIGMSAETQKRLFEKFYRIKNKETENISGTGLGLWITKALCEKLDGQISVESIEGVGSKFTITFPLLKP